MTTTTDRPIHVDGVRLDSLAWNVSKINRATAMRRPVDIPLPGVDGVNPSLNDALDAVPFGLEMFVRGRDADGLVPAAQSQRDRFRDNLDELVHLFGKRHALLEVTEQVRDEPPAERTQALAEWVARQSSLGLTGLDILLGPSDSIAEGAEVGWQDNWTYLFAQGIAARLGQEKFGYYVDSHINGAGGDPWPIAYTGTIAVDTNFGLGRQSALIGTAGKATLTVKAGAIGIMWTQGTGSSTGLFRWRIDGGAWSANINTGFGAVVDCGKETLVDNLDPDVTHVLEAEYVSGNPWILNGFMVYGDTKDATPLRIWEAGLPGAQAQAYADPAAPWWRTAVSNRMAGTTGLCILPIGFNDFNGASRTKAQIKTDIETIITNLRTDTAQPGLAVVLVRYWEPAVVGVPAGATWAEMGALYQEIADADDEVTYLDLNDVFGAPGSALRASLTLGGGDDVHPNETGYRLMADHILATVTSVLEPTSRRALAKVVDTITPDVNEPGTAATFAVGLTVPSGTWEDVDATDWTTGFIEGPGGIYLDAVPMEVHTLRGATERILDAIIVVKGPANFVTISDPATGAFVTLQTPNLGADDYWRLNCGTWSSRASVGSPLTPNSPDTAGTDVTGQTFAGGTPGQACFLPLTPTRNAAGERVVQIALSGDTEMLAATQMVVRARRRYAI